MTIEKIEQMTIIESYHIHRKSNKFEIDWNSSNISKKTSFKRSHTRKNFTFFLSNQSVLQPYIVINKSKFQLAKRNQLLIIFNLPR